MRDVSAAASAISWADQGLGTSSGGASLDIGSGQPGQGASRTAVFLQQTTR
ncbi:hypothetical protein VTH06DRAFT_2314 [Thermothelomyces fergusii]